MDKLKVLIAMLGLAVEAQNKEAANRYLAAIGEQINVMVMEVQSWPTKS